VSLDDFPNVKFDKPIRRVWWEQLLGLNNTPASLPALNVSGDTTRLDPSSGRPHFFSNQEQRSRKPASRHSISDPILEPLSDVQEAKEPGAPYHTLTSLSRLMPRMELFHRVMKDEVRPFNSYHASVFIIR
jgi:hypothetical protein